VSFSSKQTFCDVKVMGVTSVEDGTPVKYLCSYGMSSGQYAVV